MKSKKSMSKTPPFGGIGSEFYLPIDFILQKNRGQFNKYSFGHTKLFLSSGRDSLNCISKILDLSINYEILLPSYLCQEVLNPFKNIVNIVFYKINEDLSINIEDIRTKLSKYTKAILVIHYFGFPQDISILKNMQKNSSFVIIEDVVQSFLSEHDENVFGQCGDISISSYRKWIPIPDGSLLTFNKEQKNNIYFLTSGFSHHLYIFLRSVGLLTKYLYVRYNIISFRKIFTICFVKSERLLSTYNKPAKISKISSMLLDKFDYTSIVKKRRENFKYLLDGLKNEDAIKPLFQVLPKGVCPLGFPIIVDNRDSLKKKLIENFVYTPVHWELPHEINEKDFPISRKISKHILTIPIDQRYTTNDMDYILKILKI